MACRARAEDARRRLAGMTTVAPAATSPTFRGQSTSACRPAVISAIAAATVIDHPIHSIRLRSGPPAREKRAAEAGPPPRAPPTEAPPPRPRGQGGAGGPHAAPHAAAH